MYFSLKAFCQKLEKSGQLVYVQEEVSTILEITEIHRRLIQQNGPAVIFNNVKQHGPLKKNLLHEKNIKPEMVKAKMPVICNLFGTVERIAMALGYNSVQDLRELGKKLAELQHPSPPSSWQDIKAKLPMLNDLINMRPKYRKGGQCQELCYLGEEVNLYSLPIQTCWPNEPAPLITWGMVITRNNESELNKKTSNIRNASDYNAGIYRLQLLSHNKLIVRWLKHRGGADHYRQWQKTQLNSYQNNSNAKEYGSTKKNPSIAKNRVMPIAVVIGCEPSMLLSAVMPLPEILSEYNFAGLLGKRRLSLTDCITVPMIVPSSSEIVLEGYIDLDDLAEEGPYGDHTGFYNEKELFPTMTVTAITTRKNPIYLTTYTGKPIDEPATLGMALNEIFVPIIQKQFPEIVNFCLPPEACSYRIAVVSIRKSYPGHAKRIMMGIWSYLRQFTYTKFVIVVDENIDVWNWKEVMWAVSTHMDFKRDVTIIENTPIDYLDFASSEYELGAKIGFDATTKVGKETNRNWGIPIGMSDEIVEIVNKKWKKYGFKN